MRQVASGCGLAFAPLGMSAGGIGDVLAKYVGCMRFVTAYIFTCGRVCTWIMYIILLLQVGLVAFADQEVSL